MKKFYITCFLVFANLVCYAQGNCLFTHYSSEDGLSQNTVMSILQDHKGNMWFATWDGINKFNGYSFKTYKARQRNFITLTNNRVDYMYEDIHGYLWVLTYDNRAHRFDPRAETFEQVPSSGEASTLNISSINVLPNGTVWLLTEDDGAIRVTTDPHTLKLNTTLYSVKSGLFPAIRFRKICLDSAGNEWFLTNNGLGMIRPGDKTPVSYFVETQNMLSHSDQTFYAFHEQGDEIFFGSDKGRVWRYQKKTGRFQLLEFPAKSHIVSIDAVATGELIITTSTDGFFTYHLKTKKITHYSPIGNKQFPDRRIHSTYVDKSSEVWFEQEEPGCVVHFNPFTKALKLEQMKTEAAGADRARPAFNIHEDINGYLWVHPFGGGFSYFDRKKNKLVPFYDEPESKQWKFSNKIHSTFSDKQGNLWICTHSKGLEKITFSPSKFYLDTPEPHDYESLSNEVRALYEDNEQNMWVGLKNGILRVYDKNNHYTGYLTESGTISFTGNPLRGVTYSLMQDRKGILWIATKGDGLIRAEKTGKSSPMYKLTRYEYNADDIYSLSNNNVYSVYEDHHGRIWVATFAGGLNYMSKDKRGNVIFINHRNNLKGYPIDNCYKVRFVTSDNKGHLWVGTTTGAISFNENFVNPEDIHFNQYSRIPSDVNSLSNNDVHWIIATKKKELYLATFGGGLNKLVSMDKNGQAKFKSYTVDDGLPSDVLLSVREDHKGSLWISTENGISKFIPSQNRFENYDDKSLPVRVRFNEAASAITASGNIFFGASNGIFSFNPDSIRKSNYIPPIAFSRLLISSKEVVPGKSEILKQGLDETPELKLSHNENIFSIQYAALDYTNPANIQYAYMLQGFEDNWIYADKQRSATYTNLPKGHYTFKVKSTNSDGVWVENTRTIDIIVLPSFWETPLAYLLYILFILLIIFVAVYILFTIYRLKHEVFVEQQVSDIKLRFFTDISHELRTPLTLIAGPVEYVLKNMELPHEVREHLVVVERNTNRMLRLVNQILDFRKIQNKKMKMQVQNLNIVSFLQRVMENFEPLAVEHHIDFVFETEKDKLNLWVDVDKFEKIIFNLLSNAFKYTPNGKMITVFVREDENTVTVGVQDQGIGIADSKKGSIFVRFENLVDKNLFNQSSTGIGLSLVKELVEMHKAVIEVDSSLGEGSCFKINFLKGRNHYDDTVEFILDDSMKTNSSIKDVQDECNLEPLSQEQAELSEKEADIQKEVMLLVEDNSELRLFLRSVFSQTYRVVEAVDGMEGWSKALKYLPDIIISDVMMPEKDGIQLTKELRADMATSHIPIILLTAKTSIESKLEGMEYGADDYITKPFSATYLKARVENLLSQRHKLQLFYRDNLMNYNQAKEEVEKQKPEMSSIDRKFMDKLVEVMEKNMDNGDLIVDDLVSELAVSRSVFFKKLKNLTGLAPIEFIKEMRIKRAAQLIETGEFNMTQISYMVGINDPRYFSKCFKQKFSMTPTEYRDSVFNK
ncbi:two-component regulator propeller domain-containing protein [uncultured Bacteroides sp.]|uniref:hybrid sensor histidine kinase/response regulator transcription factor n=1 Tax=uncultured Bacteroides sp. TaxID=162156 RepID=UPI002AA67013|nr:two-component regulator propeller domain-containing protein [uncultured Bacteroides sp.]